MSELPRLNAYGMIDAMPEKGMPEVLEFLAETLEFYRRATESGAPCSRLVSRSTTLQGILLPATTRPEITFDP